MERVMSAAAAGSWLRAYSPHIAGRSAVSLRLLCALCATILGARPADAAAPQVLHTPGYESPVRADPDDLLMISGYGFQPSDRVVYQQVDGSHPPTAHPVGIPKQTSPSLGVAPIVQLASPAYTLTVRLPESMRANQVYALWVVNLAGEWSDAMLINDSRPMWISPSSVSESGDPDHTGRRLRVVGRNLQALNGAVRIRLQGPASYLITGEVPDTAGGDIQQYVIDAPLPARMAPGDYSVSITRNGRDWTVVPQPRLQVRTHAQPEIVVNVSEPRFGECRANDGKYDNDCFAKAIALTGDAGGGVIVVPTGTWDLSAGRGFTLPAGVSLKGAGDGASILLRHDAKKTPAAAALITLTNNNSILGLTFTDTDHYDNRNESRTVLLLGRAGSGQQIVGNVVIAQNEFLHVGRAITDSGLPIKNLYITHNEFGAYDEAIKMTGNRFGVAIAYHLQDSVIRWNRFVPGSYLDLAQAQGTIAAEIGAGTRLDFSTNIVDGASTVGLQDPTDQKGFRAAFFWNMSDSHENVLVSGNRVSCSGDKDGDGEAIAFDGNANTFAFKGMQTVAGADARSVTIGSRTLTMQNGVAVPHSTYYEGFWVQVVEGPGVGQVRRVESYSGLGGETVIRVSPRWDITPIRGQSRVIVGREYRQVFAVGNESDHREPPCAKSNLSGDFGGRLGMWAPSTDSVFAANHMYDTDGIVYQQAYTTDGASFQSAFEIRDNLIDGEYEWSSDCSTSGIMGSFAATPEPQYPPPALGLGVVIAHNKIARADGFKGGGIDMASTWHHGPPPGQWPLVQNLLIFHNSLQDIGAPAPRVACHWGQKYRSGIRLDGTGNVHNTVLYANECERVSKPLDDGGVDTTRVCEPAHANSCECDAQPPR